MVLLFKVLLNQALDDILLATKSFLNHQEALTVDSSGISMILFKDHSNNIENGLIHLKVNILLSEKAFHPLSPQTSSFLASSPDDISCL